MALPDSYKVTASSTSLIDYVKALESHFANTSTKFSVASTNDDTANSGDYGIEITPDDAGESWGAAIFYDDTNIQIRAFLDPNNSISDPIDPTSGSSDTSPVSSYWIRDLSSAGYTPDTEFLLAEFADAFVLMIKYADQSNSHDKGFLGRIYQPAYGDDASFDLDGLGVHGTDARLQDNNGQYRIGTSNWSNANENSTTDPTSRFPNGRLRPSRMALEENNTWQILGFWKYWFRWVDSNFQALERIDDGTNEGYIVVTDGFGGGYAIPWDTAVQPD